MWFLLRNGSFISLAELVLSGFTNEELIIRLKSFPKELLEKIKITDKTFLDDFDIGLNKIIKEINS